MMQLHVDTLEYLQGRKYSNALTLAYIFEDEDFHYRTQIDLLCELATEKKVIHLGCADHTIATVKHKNKRKKWLHSRLCKVASRCHGVDREEEVVAYIRDDLGFTDTSCDDVFSPEFHQLVESDTWDYLFIPEVLEHLENPGEFLRELNRRYGRSIGQLVVTVPNGLSHDNYRLARKGLEVINSDHRFWFTPYTLTKAAVDAGLRIDKILMCRHGSISWRNFRRNRFYRKYPLLRNDILCLADFSN